MKDAVNPDFSYIKKSFWISFDDFVKYFGAINVCRMRNWDEIRQ